MQDRHHLEFLGFCESCVGPTALQKIDTTLQVKT